MGWSNCVFGPCHAYSAWRVPIKLNLCSLPCIQRLTCTDQTTSLSLPFIQCLTCADVSLFLTIHRAPGVCWSKWISICCNSYSATVCVQIKLNLSFPYNWYSFRHVLIKLSLFSLQLIQCLAYADQTEPLFLAIYTVPSNVCWSYWVNLFLAIPSQRPTCAEQTKSLFCNSYSTTWCALVKVSLSFHCQSYSVWRVLVKLCLFSLKFSFLHVMIKLNLAIYRALDVCWSN